MSDLLTKSSRQLSHEMASGTRSPESLVNLYLDRIRQYNPDLNIYVRHLKNTREVKAPSQKGKLYGIPLAIKDNICVKGMEITCASQILKGYVAPYNATVIHRVLAEGAVILGLTNMDEFAFGSSCETSSFGPTHNPWELSRSPGGSSGGSAAAVSASLAAMAIGSDTGGSIRQPASFCGVVGLKPTYGRVSRFGLVAFGSSLDQIGPFAHNIEDAALLLSVIAGFDPKDSTSADKTVPDYLAALGEPVKGMRIGVPKEFFSKELAPEIKSKMDEALELLSGEGCEVVPVSLPSTQYSVPVYYIIAPSEASSNLARFDGVRYGMRDKSAADLLSMYTQTRDKGFGEESKRRILLGTFALSSGYYDAYYLKAMKVRKKMIQEMEGVFKEVDVLLTPTSPTTAFKIGEKINDPWTMYLSDIYTISANLTGVPAVSIPCGLSSDRLPIGLQLMAKPFDESTLLKVAFAYENKSGIRNLVPGLETAG